MRFLGYLWAAPNTALGLAVYAVFAPFGARASLVDGVIEIEGPPVAALLARVPLVGGASALTLGHAVLARSAAEHARTRRHERVHVRQYARWGPFFLPAYALSSLLAWRRGLDPYRDNAFEREAYAIDERD
ncbi:MAG: hypothetical protein U0572_16945 [Phycisphaerales bacterium]